MAQPRHFAVCPVMGRLAPLSSVIPAVLGQAPGESCSPTPERTREKYGTEPCRARLCLATDSRTPGRQHARTSRRRESTSRSETAEPALAAKPLAIAGTCSAGRFWSPGDSLISLPTRFVLHLFSLTPTPAAFPPVPPGFVTFRVLLTSRFHNASSADMELKALLGDLETHSLDCNTCQVRFLQPWAQQGLTPKQWQDLELLIHRSLSDFILTVTRIAQQQGMGCEYGAS
nr:uncharacterized protein LOC125621394 [Caretta caretta]